jgi:tetratricopeptide (TPR) repeat protein
MRTWEYWAAHRRDGEPIGLEDYEAIGTMTEALSRHADEAWGELPDERSRQIAEKLFKSLSEKGADNREIRRPTRLSVISATAEATEAEVIAAIDVFRREGRSFLMPPAEVKLASATVIDISHESLIRNWVRLQKWVDEEAQSARIYHRLAESAVLHREGKEGLLTDPALQIALEWREKERPNSAWGNHYHSEFETAISFLDASRDRRDSQFRAEEQRRVNQRRLRFALTLGLILLLAGAGIWSVGYSYRRADRKRSDAETDKLKRQQKSTDADARGDFYVELGKYEDAEPYYLEALAQRTKDGDPVELRKSWDKLTKLYRKTGPKDYPKAEMYNELLIAAYAVDPNSLQYADALVQRAALYVQEATVSKTEVQQSNFSQGESYYNQALPIFAARHDWSDENIVLYRLTKLYEQQNKKQEREQALKNRVNTLAAYFKQLTSPASPDAVYLVSEYLYALDALAYFYQDNAEAEAVYEQALAASDYITSSIPSANNKNIPTRYAAMLGHYLNLVESRNDPAEAEKIAELGRVLSKLPQPRVKTTAPQNVQTAQPSPTPETSPP